MIINDIWQQLWKNFWEFFSKDISNERPYLAHYTSLESLVKIFEQKEIWFSHPYFMNDHQEIMFSMKTIPHILCNQTKEIENILGDELASNFFNLFIAKDIIDFADDNLIRDKYIFCLSECDDNSLRDGLLSMWRGYGGKGYGSAIVFDSNKIEKISQSPFIIRKVNYRSQQEMLECNIELLINHFKKVKEIKKEIKRNFTYDEIHCIASSLYKNFVLYSFFNKHVGFKEEKEWRVLYDNERDTNNTLTDMIDYNANNRFLEPKLKFKIKPNKNITSDDFSLSKIVHQIILGPCKKDSPLLRDTLKKVLIKSNCSDLQDKIVLSSIPFQDKK